MSRTGVLLPLLLAVGCTWSDNGTLAWQRNYARSIPDPNSRAQALGTMAMSAAATADSKTANALLDDMKGDPSFDEYAGRCAVELNRAGRSADARRVARRVTDPDRRKELLDKIAKPVDRPGGESAGAPQTADQSGGPSSPAAGTAGP
jgi:hypothetical protein